MPSVSITRFKAGEGGLEHCMQDRVLILTFKVDPQVIGVEDLELANYTSFQQTSLAR